MPELFKEIFSDGELVKFLNKNKHDPWVNTNFENYVYLLNTQKGIFGEMFVERYMRKKGSIVMPRENKGHDRIIDGYKTEIKFSLCVRSEEGLKEDFFMINHISINKDWERLIYFGVNFALSKSRLIWFNKEDFIQNVDSFKNQQGGKTVDNDDFMYSGDINNLLILPFIKKIDFWDAKIGPLEYFYA